MSPKRLNLSSRPLKALNWTKIPATKVKETLWKDLGMGDEEYLPVLDDEFEDLFAAREGLALGMKKSGTIQSSMDGLANLTATSKEITFLDSKRSQNCNIMLKAIKLPIHDIRQAVNQVDTNILQRHILAELLKFIPTEDELRELSVIPANEIENLAPAERFLYEISFVERYEDKIKALVFQTGFEEMVQDISGMINWWRKACKSLQESKQFKELLKIILAMGNYMNAGQRGGAYGFKLNSLLKVWFARKFLHFYSRT